MATILNPVIISTGGVQLLFKNNVKEEVDELKFGSLVKSTGGQYNSSQINIPSNAIPVVLKVNSATTTDSIGTGYLYDNKNTVILKFSANQSGSGANISGTYIYLPTIYSSKAALKAVTNFHFYAGNGGMYSTSGLEVVCWAEE